MYLFNLTGVGEILISVIVPLYNVELYIGKCVTSILEQTYCDWELILINDGSQDDSGKICDEYAKQDSRIKVIHQKNQGVSVARNIGIESSLGDYITFLDADDYISERYFEHMLNCMKVFSVDVVVANMCEVAISGVIVGYQNKIAQEEVIASNVAMARCLYERQLSPSVCGKMFKRDIWKNEKFPENCVLAEDIWALYNVLRVAKNVALCNKAVYYVYLRGGSAQRSVFSPHKMAALDVCEKIVEDSYSNLQMEIYKAATAKLVAVSFQILLQLSTETPKIYHERCWNRIKKDRYTVILDTKVKNKTRVACFLSFFGGKLLKAAFILSKRVKQYICKL